jgi:DNA-binding GntR family transcriptional regulator
MNGKEQSAYVDVLQYLNRLNKPVSPHELVTVLGKSRVTIHAALRRLSKSGWVTKQGTSPKVFYRAIDPFARKVSEPTLELRKNLEIGSVKAFIAWCREQGYHVPEVALEYQKFYSRFTVDI